MPRPKIYTDEEIAQRKKEQQHKSFLKWYEKEENKAYNRNINKKNYWCKHIGEEKVNEVIQFHGDLDKALPYLKFLKSSLKYQKSLNQENISEN